MKTQNQMDIGFFEKLTDGLGAFSEGMVGFLGRLFGSSNDRIVRTLGFVRPKGSIQHTVVPGSYLDQVDQPRRADEAPIR